MAIVKSEPWAACVPSCGGAAAHAMPPRIDAPKPRREIFFNSRFGVNPPCLIRYSNSVIKCRHNHSRGISANVPAPITIKNYWSVPHSPPLLSPSLRRAIVINRHFITERSADDGYERSCAAPTPATNWHFGASGEVSLDEAERTLV
jgi:hypothetical protein